MSIDAVHMIPRPSRAEPSRYVQLRRQAGSWLVDHFFRGVASTAGRLPIAQPGWHGVEVLRDIPYAPDGGEEHLLDIYRPVKRSGALPVIFYTHGGGFRILTKDTHWLFALAFARRGYLVVNINYRLAPRHPFPAAPEDAAAALEWTLSHVAGFGGDPTRVAVAGESAGANIATALVLATCTPRPEPWARRTYGLGFVPNALLPACGILQVSDTDRFGRMGGISSIILDRLIEVEEAYLQPDRQLPPGAGAMADPLLILEDRRTTWTRPLPPFFATCGTADPLVDDTRRLAAALQRLGVTHEARYYHREYHAFHAFYPLPNARLCWQHTFEFLDRHMPPTAAIARHVSTPVAT